MFIHFFSKYTTVELTIGIDIAIKLLLNNYETLDRMKGNVNTTMSSNI